MFPRVPLLLAVFILVLALVLDQDLLVDRQTTDPREEAVEATLARNAAASRRRASAGGVAPEEAWQPKAAKDDTFTRFRRGPDVASAPPGGELVRSYAWLEPTTAIVRIQAAAEATGRGWVFGWIQMRPGFDRAVATVEWGGHGVDVLGFAGAFARVRLPESEESIRALANHGGVVGLGVRPGAEKIVGIMSRFETSRGEIPVLIGLMDEDPHGVWRTELEARGAVVGDWLPGVRAYAANVRTDEMVAMAAADFVASIEPAELVHALLDTAVTVMGADGLRTYDEATGSFTGTTGSSVAVGFADSGLNIAHGDIASGRESICGRNFYPDSSDGDGNLDLWSDYGGHGTHVAGIVAGRGSASAEFAGMAPEIGHLRVAKVINRDGTGDVVTVANGIRYLLRETSCEWEGEESGAVRPLIVNLSIGGDGERNGRGAANRNLDSAVWRGSQLFVFAAGNSGSDGTTNESATKNGLAVGAVTDAGVVASFSSHGPTADGRLVPHVVGTGSALLSAKGNSSSTAYARATGTSMAAPSVAGVAALLMDSDAEFAGNPAYVKARLMASAVKPSPTLDTDDFPLDNSAGPGAFNAEYGLGLVSAGVAVGDGPDGAWSHGGDHGIVEPGASYEYTIEVPENAARLDVVLTWIEPPGESVGTKAVAADLDLYVDLGGDCETAACGEYASTSSVDNVEWILVEEPVPGTYGIRIVAAPDFADPVRAGIAWTVIAETDAPGLTVAASDTAIDIGSGDAFEIELEVSTGAYVAAGTTLHMACRSESPYLCEGYEFAHWRPVSEVDRGDGTSAGVDAPVTGAVALGEVRVGDVQRVVLVAPRDVATSSHTLYFVASSWNATAGVTALDVRVGGHDAGARESPPGNDGVTDAVALAGESGEVAFDLLLASREPGEPMRRQDRRGSGAKKFFFESRRGEDGYDEEMQDHARHGSVWFSIEASRSGPYRLSVEPDWAGAATWISIYEGSGVSDATRIAEHESVAEFVATSAARYLVQVWSRQAGRHPARLVWNQHEDVRPENDDFDDRTELAGLRGVVEGTNYRATLEGFEFYGAGMLGASTWYRWTAPSTGRFGLSYPRGFDAIVLAGTQAESLRRVSTMPRRSGRAQFLAERDQEYQIVVLDSGEGLIPDYHLSWHPVEGSGYGYAENDLLVHATAVEGAPGSASISSRESGTVSSDEDWRTGVGTRWWQWAAPGAGRYVFRLEHGQYGNITAFTGPREAIEYVADGRSVLVEAAEGDRYWFAVGFRADHMFADFDGGSLGGALSWGAVPANDTPATAMPLAGTEGDVAADHTYATNSADEPDGLRGHSSLWWRWEAPSTGWQRFALEDWEALGHEEPTQQSVLAIYRRPDQGPLSALATSDHSYVANGRAEAVFRGEAGEEYLVRVALRATDLGDWSRKTGFSYAPVGTPAWQRYAGRVVEVGGSHGDSEDGGLVEPKSVAVDGDSGLVVVATRDRLVAYAEGSDGTLSRASTVPYEDETGNAVEVLDDVVLHWDPHKSMLYLVQPDAVFAVRGLDGTAKHLERCPATGSDGVVPAQVTRDGKSENMYVVGSGRIEVYAGTAACQLELLQVLNSAYRRSADVDTVRIPDLGGARSLVVGPGGSRVYAASADGLVVFAREETGTLSHEATLSATDWSKGWWAWQYASVVRGGDGVLFFVGGRSARVAAFRIGDGEGGDAEEPELLGVVDGFFLDEGAYYRPAFYSHVAWPLDGHGCSASTAQEAVGPAVDVLCDGQVLTVRWDHGEEELLVSDWFQTEQADRFGGVLRGGLRSVTPSRIAGDTHGDRNYVLGDAAIGTLHVFDRASKIATDPYNY